MDFTAFRYITEIPDVIDNETWYALAVMSYNLGLTFFWFVICTWITDKLFICFRSLYRKGSN